MDDGPLPRASEIGICQIFDEDIRLRLMVLPRVVVAFTSRDDLLPFAIELLESEPPLDFESWDHIVEGGIDITSGVILFSGPSSDPYPIPTTRGCYRVRVCQANLDSVTGSSGDGDDHYLVQFWPSENRALTVLKQYVPPAEPRAPANSGWRRGRFRVYVLSRQPLSLSLSSLGG